MLVTTIRNATALASYRAETSVVMAAMSEAHSVPAGDGPSLHDGPWGNSTCGADPVRRRRDRVQPAQVR